MLAAAEAALCGGEAVAGACMAHVYLVSLVAYLLFAGDGDAADDL